MNANSKSKQLAKLKLINFYGHNFFIDEHVLIPRPETEMAIDAILNLAGISYLPGVKPATRKLKNNPQILDVGTGSGCIAITLALKLPKSKVIASDISTPALKIAKKNAKNLNANIKLIKSDLLDNVNFIPDLIVANLPYVDESWDWLDKVALSREPSLALYAKDGGLELIKKLINQASTKHVKYLILEADPCQHKKIKAYAALKNYHLSETRDFILVFTYL